jgi:Ribbon-helix-helix domain
MPDQDLTRLTITWSKETDLALRSYPGAQGLKKGAISKFIEDAVKWRLFDETVEQARARFADLPPDEIEALIEEAVQSARRDMREAENGRGYGLSRRPHVADRA